MAAGATAYPRELSHTETLGDGTRVLVRAIRPDDAERLTELYLRLSRHTAYQRFFTVMPRLPADWARQLADVDYQTRLALVAERDGAAGVELIGVARYEPADEPGTAEVAVVVEDRWQGHGLGRRLLGDLLAAAEQRGIRRFCAYMLGENRRMAALLARLVDIRERTAREGVVRAVFTARPDPSGAAA